MMYEWFGVGRQHRYVGKGVSMSLSKMGLFIGLLSVCGWAAGHQKPSERDTLTDGFGGLNEAMEPSGIEFSLSLTTIYQQNARGGMSTSRHQGRWSGSYNFEMTADLERLLGVEGAQLYMLAEGTWSRRDIDETSVGSAFGVNGDFAPRETFNIIEFWYQQSFFDDSLRLRIGKLDMTGGFDHRGCPVSFDCNAYANDENTQFLNSALVNNPTIPFPDYGLGAIVFWNPFGDWYLSVGAADAQADKRETGFNTAFHGEDYFVYLAETGITPQWDSANGPLQGAYRVGVWYSPEPRAHSDADKVWRDDTGVYLSFDQLLAKENNDPDDAQGLGAFFRYGIADSKTNDIPNFYSVGVQYQGLLEGRDDDVLGIGYARGFFSDRASTTYRDDYESVIETYYNMQITRWLGLTPSVQYVANPGGTGSTRDAVVAGLRAMMTF
jgi:porin